MLEAFTLSGSGYATFRQLCVTEGLQNGRQKRENAGFVSTGAALIRAAATIFDDLTICDVGDLARRKQFLS